MASTSTSQPTTPRGAFIVFEGVDRCGKTTQSKLLEERLRNQGVKVERWCFPDRSTVIGQLINKYLQDQSMALDPVAVHLLFVANRQEKRQALVTALRSGITVIVDRYSYSGCAYDAAKGLVGLSLEYCRDTEVGLPAADAVLYMHLGPEAQKMRGGYGGERYENVEMQAKVKASFAELHDERWLDVDASPSVEAIHQQVVEHVEAVMEKCKHLPVSRLWDGQPYAELADKLVEGGVASTSAPSTAAAGAPSAPSGEAPAATLATAKAAVAGDATATEPLPSIPTTTSAGQASDTDQEQEQQQEDRLSSGVKRPRREAAAGAALSDSTNRASTLAEAVAAGEKPVRSAVPGALQPVPL